MPGQVFQIDSLDPATFSAREYQEFWLGELWEPLPKMGTSTATTTALSTENLLFIVSLLLIFIFVVLFFDYFRRLFKNI